MNVFIVYAHPEPKSLNGSLKDFAVSVLTNAGHQVQVSDLYAMKWKAVADGDDFPERNTNERLDYGSASGKAFTDGTQLPDVSTEQEKLLWADVVIFQFPLWWFSMPAILKGWIDRVYAYGFAYGVGGSEGKQWDRYGEGTLKGRRAMLVVTLGGREPQYSIRGVNGSIDDLLFPINHGVLYYPGMTVLPPLVVYQARRIQEEEYKKLCQVYEQRLLTLNTIESIPYRPQNGGDYDDQQELKPGLEGNATGLAIHQAKV